MKIFILVNAILELSAGLVFLFLPHLVPGVSDTDIIGVTFARMYGAAALSIAWLSFQSWKSMSPESLQIFFRTISIFHTAVALAALIGFNSGADDFLTVNILHGILAIISLSFLFKIRK